MVSWRLRLICPSVLNKKKEVVKFIADRNAAGLLVFVSPAEATICATGTRGGLKLVHMIVSMSPCGVSLRLLQERRLESLLSLFK